MGASEKKSDSSFFYVGRFAPSPSAHLHFGSLIAATASYLCARQHRQSKWLLRIEDIDEQRCHSKYSQSIIQMLENYGFQWDDDIIYQSKRTHVYQETLDSLDKYTYPCSCTRKQLSALTNNLKIGYIYPGLCRESLNNPESAQFSTRLKTYNDPICFDDLCQNQHAFCQNIAQDIGDFILKRSDGIFAYQLAVVVDDAEQGITHVVRGADLFDNTPRQIYLQQLLGFPTPDYLHFPVAVNSDGKKLSKQDQSPGISNKNKRAQLINALQFLGQPITNDHYFESIEDLWKWATQHWDVDLIPKQMKINDDRTKVDTMSENMSENYE